MHDRDTGVTATPRAAAEATTGLRAWLGSGACQSESGAYYAWVDADTGEPAFEYPEITGYALTWLAGRPDPTDEEIAAGHRAGDWLVARDAGSGGLPARAGWDRQAVYNFDLAMIATGLIGFGARFGNDGYVAEGVAIALDLAMQTPADGHLASIRGGTGTDRSVWSTEGHAHLVKAVQCLMLAAERGEHAAHAAAAAIVGAVPPIQREDGRFETHPRDEETMLHPHLYAVEGLYAWATVTGDEEALARARSATEWAWRHQLDAGGLPRFVATADGERGPEQFDLTGQGIRAALMLGLRPEGLDRAVARLADAAADGEGGLALPYQPAAERVHRNAWVSMFGAQALELASQESPSLEWRWLV